MSAPTCRFDPQQMSVWLDQTGLCFVSDPQEGYRLAKPFLREQMRKLLGQGWRQGDKTSDMDVLFHIYIPNKPGDSDSTPREIILPESFSSFQDQTKADFWRTIFEHSRIFKARNNDKKNGDYHHPNLSLAPQPQLSNIFYLLQILAPGMLVICLEHTVHDTTLKTLRVLPAASWIERTYPKLGMTLAGGIADLVSAANDPKMAFLEQGIQSVVLPDNSSSQVSMSKARPSRNLPFPSTLIDPENLKSLRLRLTSNTAAEDGKDALPQATTPQAADIRLNEGNGTSSRQRPAPQSSHEPHIADLPRPGNSTAGQKKKKSPKKKKTQPNSATSNPIRREPRYRIIPGYEIPRGFGDGYDWSVCDKDCGWCGRCQLDEY